MHYDRMKQCRTPPEGFSATKTTPTVSHLPKKPSPVPVPTNPCICEDNILSTSVPNPVPVSASFMPASKASLKPTAMHPLSTYQIPASSVPLNDNSFPNCSCQSYHPNVTSMSNSLSCSFNTTVF